MTETTNYHIHVTMMVAAPGRFIPAGLFKGEPRVLFFMVTIHFSVQPVGRFEVLPSAAFLSTHQIYRAHGSFSFRTARRASSKYAESRWRAFSVKEKGAESAYTRVHLFSNPAGIKASPHALQRRHESYIYHIKLLLTTKFCLLL